MIHAPISRVSILFIAFGLIAGALNVASTATAAPMTIKTIDARRYLTYEQEPGYFKYEFSSPSGNLRCQIAQYEDSAPWGCVAVTHSWKDPKLPDSYKAGCAKRGARLSGAMLGMFPGSGFPAICASFFPDAMSKGKALPLYTRIAVNRITCTAFEAKGKERIRCVGPRKASFTMSRSTLSFHQPAGWK